MDALDTRILSLLATSARATMAEVARRLGMSSPSVTERVRRLEADGVIRGYALDLDPVKLGYPLSAMVRIRPVPGRLSDVEARIKATPECIECDKVTGEDCFIARIVLRSIQHLDDVLAPFADCAETNSSIIKATPVAKRLPPMPGPGGVQPSGER